VVVPLVLSLMLLLGGTACQPAPSRPRLVLDDPGVSPTVRAGCALAEERCSRCHTLERVVLAPIGSPAQWQEQVARMRRMAGSAISPRDGDAIVHCLVYRSFGPAGLAALPLAARDPQEGPP